MSKVDETRQKTEINKVASEAYAQAAKLLRDPEMASVVTHGLIFFMAHRSSSQIWQ
jgi:hypothetical protein